MDALAGKAQPAWIGTTVTCPTLRYNPVVVAEGFTSLSLLHPGRVFLGVGSGEALNEQGAWPHWPERWDQLIAAIDILRSCDRDSTSTITASTTRLMPSFMTRRHSRSR